MSILRRDSINTCFDENLKVNYSGHLRIWLYPYLHIQNHNYTYTWRISFFRISTKRIHTLSSSRIYFDVIPKN